MPTISKPSSRARMKICPECHKPVPNQKWETSEKVIVCQCRPADRHQVRLADMPKDVSAAIEKRHSRPPCSDSFEISDPKSLAESAIGKPVKDADGNIIGTIVGAVASTERLAVSVKLDEGRSFDCRIL